MTLAANGIGMPVPLVSMAGEIAQMALDASMRLGDLAQGLQALPTEGTAAVHEVGTTTDASTPNAMGNDGEKPKEGSEDGETVDELGQHLQQFVTDVEGLFLNASGDFKSIFKDFGKNFKGLVDGFIKNIASGLFDKLGGLIGGGGKMGGFVGTLLGGVGSLFGFAGGGRLQAGIPAVVGERGPELIVPDGPSTVLNNAVSRASSKKAVSVNQTVNFDLVPGPTISAMIDAKKGEIERAAIEGTLRALNRGTV